MLVAKVAISLHRQRTTVFMSKPARNRWNVHARFNATCGEQVPQIVMGKSSDTEQPARPVDRALAFMDARYGVGCEILALTLNPFQQAPHIGNQRDAADFPILCASSRVAQDREFTFLEVTVSTVNAGSFPFAASAICQELDQVSSTVAVASVSVPNCFDEFQELVVARQMEKFLANLLPLNVNRRVVVPSPCLNGNIQDQPERADGIVERRRAGVLAEPRSPGKAVGL